MIKAFFSIIFLSYLHFGISFDLASHCAIEVNKRIRIGDSSISQADCSENNLNRVNCFENGYGCYFSKFEISGFAYKHGNYHGDDIIDAIIDPEAVDPTVCAKYCLSRSDCQSFTILSNPTHQNRHCYPKTTGFNLGQDLADMITYDRYAYQGITCTTGTCEETNGITSLDKIIDCRDKAQTNNDKYFVVGVNYCYRLSTCTRKSNGNYQICQIKNSMLPEKSTYDSNSLDKVNDSSNSTCLKLTYSPFCGKIPFSRCW